MKESATTVWLKRDLKVKQGQVDGQSTPPSSYRSFIAYGGYDEPYAPASFCFARRNCKLVAIPEALSSRTRGPSNILYDSKP